MPGDHGDRPAKDAILLSSIKADTSLTRQVTEVQEGDIFLDSAEAKRVLRKIDLCIIPLMGFCYMLQYMDKLALSQATMLGMLEDLKLQGSQYSWCSSVFYLGYIAWSWPTSFLIVRFPAGKYLAVTVFLWGGVLMCHAACQNFGGLMAARFFLGVGEAAVAPGFALITGMFYTRKEQPARQGAWFIGNSIANIIGGVVAYGIGKIETSSLAHWRLLFLILGGVTSAYGLVLFVFLPDSPSKAIFLNKFEAEVAVRRTIHNKTGLMDDNKFILRQAIDALLDPQLWLLFLYTLTVNFANGGLTSFSTIVIQGFGFSNLKTLLVQMPVGGAQLIFLILTSGLASIIPSARLAFMILNTITSVVGMIMVYELKGKADRLAGLCLVAVFACNIPLSLSLVSSNVGGFTKRSVASTTMFVAYCVGNIAGPQFFLAREKPKYQTGLKASLSGLSFGAGFLIILLAYYTWENRRRDRLYGRDQRLSMDEELREDLSGKTDREMSSFRYLV